MSIFRQILEAVREVWKQLVKGDRDIVAAIQANGELIKQTNANLVVLIALSTGSINLAGFAPTTDPPTKQ